MVVLSFGLRNQNIGINQILEPSRIIAFAAKWLNEKETFFYSEYHHGYDEMILQAYRLYNEADIIIHYNGTTFDLPWLHREFAKRYLRPPNPVAEVDLLKTARKVFRLDSNKLDYFAQDMGLPGKVSHSGMGLWIGCMNSDEKSWALMKKYNIWDVKLTEKLYKRVRGWVKNHPHLGRYENDEMLHCSNCAGTRLEKRGVRPDNSGAGVYQRYRCKSCGKWMKGTKTVQPYQQTRGI
jgi:hypothetical protein